MDYVRYGCTIIDNGIKESICLLLICTWLRVLLVFSLRELLSNGWACPGRADCGAVLAGELRLVLAADAFSDDADLMAIISEIKMLMRVVNEWALAAAFYRGVVAAKDNADNELLRLTCSHTSICLAYKSTMCCGINSPPKPRNWDGDAQWQK